MFFATRHSLHSSSQPVAACFDSSQPFATIATCLDSSQLIITNHNPQRFATVCVIVYLLLILTYKFTKIKGFSKNFFKTGKDICRRKNSIITIPRYTALQSHIPHAHPLIRNANIYMHRYTFTSALSLALHYHTWLP